MTEHKRQKKLLRKRRKQAKRKGKAGYAGWQFDHYVDTLLSLLR